MTNPLDLEAQESPPLEDDQQTKKPRRQIAFYPNLNASNKPTKPFSRSAAKRESVMALGSIEHLQHYFTKTGIAAETKYVRCWPRLCWYSQHSFPQPAEQIQE